MSPSSDHPDRLLFVSPRWGSVVGGAEALLRGIATRLAAEGRWQVEVATTTATDEDRWDGRPPGGISAEDGLLVHHFPCTGPGPLTAGLSRTVLRAPRVARILDRVGWRPATLACPDLDRFLRRTRNQWRAVVAAPYLHGSTRAVADIVPERAVLIPCMHAEPSAGLPWVGRMLRGVSRRYFNSVLEQELTRSLHGAAAAEGPVIGVGIETTADVEPEPELRQALGLTGDFVVFAGRAVPGKGVDRLVRLVLEHNQARPGSETTLVLVGGGTDRPAADPRIRWLGRVEPARKNGLLAAALATASMSRLESLSLQLLEGWSLGTPALVAADSPVLSWQVERSGGGFLISSPDDLAAAIGRLRQPTIRQACGGAGAELVRREYAWSTVLASFIAGLPEPR